MKVSASIELLWQVAGMEAIAGNFAEIEPEHFFAGLMKLAELPVEELGGVAQGENVARELAAEITSLRQELESRSIDSTQVRRKLRACLGKGNTPHDGGQKHRSQASRELFDAAARLADDANAEALVLEHLLHSLLATPTSAMRKVLGDPLGPKEPARSETPLLDECGKDLVRMAREDQLDKGSNRLAECKALVHSLADQRRRSVVMVCDNNHTSQSIVVAAAHSIANAECPEAIKGKCIVDVSSVNPDSDEGIQQLENVFAEAAAADEVILLTPPLEDPSDSDTSSLWGELLKRSIAGGSVQCVCRATSAAYEQWIENDRDWKQRAQAMWIKEASNDSVPWEL